MKKTTSLISFIAIFLCNFVSAQITLNKPSDLSKGTVLTNQTSTVVKYSKGTLGNWLQYHPKEFNTLTTEQKNRMAPYYSWALEDYFEKFPVPKKLNSNLLWLRNLYCLTLPIKCANPPAPNQVVGLSIKNGQYLVDACGNKVILRGVNMGAIFSVNFGETELAEIAETGANCVRLVLGKQYKDWSQGGTLTNFTGVQLEKIVTDCINKNMIPIVELQDYTGSSQPEIDLPLAVEWWTSADIKNVLQKYQKSIILNIANEPAGFKVDFIIYKNACIQAIANLRAAGYTCPLMIDAPDGGKDHSFFVENAAAIMAADSKSSVIFSVHTYWPTQGKWHTYSDDKIKNNFVELNNLNLPVVIGELPAADVQDKSYYINYSLLMSQCAQYGFGYTIWWWGCYNSKDGNNELSMTQTGLYNELQGAGKTMALTDANSIQKTAVKACNLK